MNINEAIEIIRHLPSNPMATEAVEKVLSELENAVIVLDGVSAREIERCTGSNDSRCKKLVAMVSEHSVKTTYQ